MPAIKTFSFFAAMLLSVAVYAKGHGGHGGHGGHHSSHHSSIHHSSHTSGHHSSHGSSHNNRLRFSLQASHQTTHHNNHHSANHSANHPSHQYSNQIPTRNAAPVSGAPRPAGTPARRMNHNNLRLSGQSAPNARTRYVQLPGPGNHRPPVSTVYEPYYPGYGAWYYGLGYSNPFFNCSWYDLLWLRMCLGYTPNYGYMPPPAYGGYGSNDYNSNGGRVEEDLEGFVVYARDTLRGQITLKSKTILLEKTDSGRNLDYKFRSGQEMLTAVRVLNEDDKQLELVRLKENPRKLWRLIHEVKLNLYDSRHNFIYQPEDIDIRSLKAVYNGNEIDLSASTTDETKDNLTELINTAYGSHLDAGKFTWSGLLIYLDKLDARF